MRWSALAVAMCVCAVAGSGCQKKHSAQKNLATSETPPVTTVGGGQVVESGQGQIDKVSIALHTGPDGKAASDTVVVRIVQDMYVVGQASVGQGEEWTPGSMRALEIPLSTPVDLSRVGDMRLDVSKVDPWGQSGSPWALQAEALGQVNDGRVVRLLEPSAPGGIGGGNIIGMWWTIAPK
jgi:hypothetical protein